MAAKRKTVSASLIAETANAAIAHLAQEGTKQSADRRKAIIDFTSSILLKGNAYKGFRYLDPPQTGIDASGEIISTYDDSRIAFYV